MATYRIVLERPAERALRRLPGDLARELDGAIRGLATDPRPAGCKRLKADAEFYRMGVGDARVVYTIEGEDVIILVVEIRARGGRSERAGSQDARMEPIAIFGDIVQIVHKYSWIFCVTLGAKRGGCVRP